MEIARRFPNDPRRFNQVLLSLVFVGLLIRVTAVLILDDYRDPLSAEYGIVARNLVAGKGFVGGGWLGPETPTALNTPVYPIFLAAWLRVGGPLAFLGVELSQALLSALLIYLVGQIARTLSDSSTGLVAGIFVTGYPPLIYFCKQISPAIFTTFFTMSSFYALLLFFRNPTWKRIIACGLVFGLSLLVEPILLMALPGAALIAWIWTYTGDKKSVVRKLAVGGAIGILVILPWTTRNYLVFQRVVLLKTSFGLNLWLGNNPSATGFLYTSAGEPMQETLSASTRDYLSTLNEAQRYEVLRRQAWEWIQLHPKRFLHLTIRRIGYLWLISPTYRVTEQNIAEPRAFYVVRAMIQAALLLFALAGGILAFPRKRSLVLMILWWVVVFSAPYVISVAGNTRYRLPVEPMLLILAAFCFASVLRLKGVTDHPG
jgi:4-amino-4-deoxy-L-arabinose transferase-like glycosyltransferase